MPLLSILNLVKVYQTDEGMFGKARREVRAVNGVSLDVEQGETLGLVGESGCGKTTLGRMILRLIEPTSGGITFNGHDVLAASSGDLRRLRRDMQIIFQDPFASLNPRMRVDSIIAEPLITHERLDDAAVAARVAGLLDVVGLPARSKDLFPHEFSGGQRQRIAIARALALSPRLVVLDEPVSALDVSIRAQILNLLRDLQKELGLAYLFIAHDLAAVAHMSHVIAVMYLGRIVEMGESSRVATSPQHPYTQALFAAALPAHPDEQREEIVLAGEVPSPLNPPSGCHFHPRCPKVMARCSREDPRLKRSQGREIACHLFD